MKSPVLLMLLSLLLAKEIRAADVAFFGVIRSQEYLQTNSSTPAIRASNAYVFNAFVVATTNRVVTNATVRPSSATPFRTLIPLNTNTLDTWRYEERFNSSSAAETAYPLGNFVVPGRFTNTMHTVNDGLRTVVLNAIGFTLSGNPATPQVSNFAAAQAVDHTAPFTLSFNSSGNAALDIVQVVISDTASNVVFASPAPFTSNALTGASTSFVIPANALPPGQSLVGHLTFARPFAVETNAYPGAVGIGAVARDTEFSLITRPAPARPTLSIVSNAPFLLRFLGETNRIHRLQASTNLTLWTDVLVTNGSTATFTDTGSAPQRFFRVGVGF